MGVNLSDNVDVVPIKVDRDWNSCHPAAYCNARKYTVVSVADWKLGNGAKPYKQ